MYCGDRGWGLRTGTNTIIKEGEFVNEYVGEIINDSEFKKRLKNAAANNTSKFYFLILDNNR